VEEWGWLAARDVAAGIAVPPPVPGVYAFEDGAGRVAYVGSSRDLSRRVRSYFVGAWPPASKEGRLVRLAARVGWRRAGSHLEALVAEARAIVRLRPHFNRRLKHPERYAYVRFDPADPFPRLDITTRPAPGAWRHLGPFPGGRRLAAAVDGVADALGLRTCDGALAPDPAGRACLRRDLGRCLAPCVGDATPGAYGRAVTRALAALGGADVDAVRALGAPSGPPPAALPGGVASALRALRASRIATRVVAVVPAAGVPGHRLLGVRAGRLVAAAPATRPGDLRGAFAIVSRAVAGPADALVGGDALDEIRIVTGWLATRTGRAAAVDLERLGAAAAWDAVVARAGAGPLFAAAAAQDGRSARPWARPSSARR